MPAQACRRGSTAVSAAGRSRSARPFVSRPRTRSRRPSAVAALKESPQTFDKETSVPWDDWRNDVNRSGRTRGARLQEEAGAAAVEFAIVASLFFMLVFAIIDFGFGFHTWNGTAHAAREGARLAAVDPDPRRSRAGFARRPGSWIRPNSPSPCSAAGMAGGFSACPTSASSWAEGDYMRVIVDYRYPYITPLPGFVGLGDDLNLHSQSEVRFEGAYRGRSCAGCRPGPTTSPAPSSSWRCS